MDFCLWICRSEGGFGGLGGFDRLISLCMAEDFSLMDFARARIVVI